MSEQCTGILRCNPEDLSQAMSIHTRKITDSCRDKDCIEDLRVYLTVSSQELLSTASGAKARSAELLYADIEVEPVAFDCNHYCIDVTFYYQILADATTETSRPASLYGLAIFSKRAVLCGEDNRAHIFSSDTQITTSDSLIRRRSNRPTAVVEVLDPMVLSSHVTETCEGSCLDVVQIPEFIQKMFDEELVLPGDHRQLYVTLGQFSIIRLERNAQLIVPVLDYAIPTKECCDSAICCGEDPCEMFSRIPFPARQFTPTSCDSVESLENPLCGSPDSHP